MELPPDPTITMSLSESSNGNNESFDFVFGSPNILKSLDLSVEISSKLLLLFSVYVMAIDISLF